MRLSQILFHREATHPLCYYFSTCLLQLNGFTNFFTIFKEQVALHLNARMEDH